MKKSIIFDESDMAGESEHTAVRSHVFVEKLLKLVEFEERHLSDKWVYLDDAEKILLWIRENKIKNK